MGSSTRPSGSARPLSRRSFLTAVAAGAGVGLGSSFWRAAFATPAPPGPGPYGPLDGREPDENGIILPPGFRSRVVARTGEAVAGTSYVWPTAPDGQATFALSDGGWILVTNSEWASARLLGILGMPADLAAALGGGVSAIRFDRGGRIVDAYRILGASDLNCAGGPTPWGTWLSGEEWDVGLATQDQYAAGLRDDLGADRAAAVAVHFFRDGVAAGHIWECDPQDRGEGVALPALGRFAHEAAAVDPATNIVYMTEDQHDGLLYRFVPSMPHLGGRPDLGAGRLEAARIVDPGLVLTGTSPVAWLPVPDPGATTAPTRSQVPGATRFERGEGMWFDSGTVYFTTTADERVWSYECSRAQISVIHDRASAGPDAPLRNPDNITVNPRTGDLLVAEDPDDLELVLITAPGDDVGRVTAPFARFTPAPGVAQVRTEITGPCFDPSGTRLYVSSQRGIETSSFPFPQRGITYEITGPFHRRHGRRTTRGVRANGAARAGSSRSTGIGRSAPPRPS